MKCMTVVEEGGKIAFAVYLEAKNEILVEESHIIGRGNAIETIVQSFISLARPNLILIPTKIAANGPLLELLTSRAAPPLSDDLDQNENGNRNQQDQQQIYECDNSSNVPYQLLKSKAFDLKNCKNLILNKLRVMALIHKKSRTDRSAQQMPQPNNMHGQYTSTQASTSTPSNYHSIASIVNFDSNILLRVLGSLLCHLQGTIFRLEEDATITVNTIQYAKSSQFMRIDTATLHALHIFSTKNHGRKSKGTNIIKEGFSLFTLLDRTKSKVGKQCLKEWMLKPLLDPRAIEERQDGVSIFLRGDCREIAAALVNFLAKVGAVDKILLKMQKCHSVPMDFIVLSKTLSAATSIIATLNGELRNQLIQIQHTEQKMCRDEEQIGEGIDSILIRRQIAVVDSILSSCHVSVLHDLHERIISIIDQEGTAESKEAVVINYGFHEELDNAKELFDNLDETLSIAGSEVLQQYPSIESLKVVFLPQVGFLIAVDKRNHRHDIATNEFPDLPQDFLYVFVQENEAFFKNPNMRGLDEEYGDLDAFIKDTERLIVGELEEDTLDCEFELRSTFGSLAVLDCFLAFASCASDLNFVRPQIIAGGDSGIYIESGRHPLQELIVENDFIPNDTNIDQSRTINVVTGPNFSGKSCYTRQVGMLVYMAHIGCFIPCDQARISITDQILARISSVETCAVPQSSFQLDLTQMATILHRSTSNSLVLIDEFGKGTSPVSGIAVLTAAIKKLMTIKCKVICTTHFLEIFSLKLLSDGVDNVKVLHMAVHIPDSDDDDAVPLFKLEYGIARSSAGVVCAKMSGVHEDVTARAREILGALKHGNQVKPIPANQNSNSVFQRPAKVALRHFLGNDSWKNESESELLALQRKISLM